MSRVQRPTRHSMVMSEAVRTPSILVCRFARQQAGRIVQYIGLHSGVGIRWSILMRFAEVFREWNWLSNVERNS